jgi:hypothetical protein
MFTHFYIGSARRLLFCIARTRTRIVIDAADNAQMAAEEIGEARSFARDLLREIVPDDVRFVFLCRSHRQAMLDPPAQALRLQ